MQKRDHYLDFISIISSFDDQIFDFIRLVVLVAAQSHLLDLLLVIQEHLLEKVALHCIIINVYLQTIALLHSKLVRGVQGCNRPVFYNAYLRGEVLSFL